MKLPLHPNHSTGFTLADLLALLAVGTRFAEIATGSYGVTVPENLIHVDINPDVFSANYPAKIGLDGDAGSVLRALLAALKQATPRRDVNHALRNQLRDDKQAYRQSWYAHDSKGRVNPVRFFDELRKQTADNALTVVDDGTFENRRGSLTIDDEGTPTQRNVLIEDGIYAATAAASASSGIAAAAGRLKVYVLHPDVDARGMTGKLLDGELVEGHVRVERVDDPVAPGPDVAQVIALEAVGVGVAGEIKPGARPADAEVL